MKLWGRMKGQGSGCEKKAAKKKRGEGDGWGRRTHCTGKVCDMKGKKSFRLTDRRGGGRKLKKERVCGNISGNVPWLRKKSTENWAGSS